MLFLPSEGREVYDETYQLCMLAGYGYHCGAGQHMKRFVRNGWVEQGEDVGGTSEYGLVTAAGFAELSRRARAQQERVG